MDEGTGGQLVARLDPAVRYEQAVTQLVERYGVRLTIPNPQSDIQNLGVISNIPWVIALLVSLLALAALAHALIVNVGRSRGNVAAAMSRVRAAALTIGISSDLLYPNYQQRQIDELLRSEGVDSRYVEIDSPHGHDAFLINLDQLAEPISRFLG